MFKNKKKVSMVVSFILAISFMSTSSFAINQNSYNAVMENNEPYTINLKSKEFPNAYIEQKVISSNEKERVIQVETYVEDHYDYSNNKKICKQSKLLSKNEVDRIGKNSFLNENTKALIIPSVKSSITSGVNHAPTVSRYKLTLTFVVSVIQSSDKTTYCLQGTALWNGGSISGELGPAVGEDYIGFAWGGNFSLSSTSITGKSGNNSVPSSTFYPCSSSPNIGYAWGFNEILGHNTYFLTSITAKANIYKYKPLNNGDTSVTFQYIHTYQSIQGSVSFSASSQPSFSLGGVPKQWTLVSTMNGITC